MLALLGLGLKIDLQKTNKSFRHEKHSNAATLSQYIWKLNNNKVNFKIQWEILKKKTKNKYNLKNGCKFCNAEKIEILTIKESEPLNERNELQTGCLHYWIQFI